MDGRVQKQLIIGLIFVLIFGGIGYGIFDKLFLIETTCFDQIQNGKEDGVDCGVLACDKACEPVIMPIEVLSTQVFAISEGDFDLVAKLYNPNTSHGASRAEYAIDAFNYHGFTYILPGQTKYVVLTSLKSPDKKESTALIVNNAQWEKLDMPNNAMSFVLRRKDYHSVQKGMELDAVLYNDSNFDFDKIDIVVILFDDVGSIVGVGKTDIRTFVSKSERGFNVAWPFALPGNVVRQDVEASTNLFENSNFIKSYGTQEKFQKFY